jgi:DNA repair protein RadA/Sms
MAKKSKYVCQQCGYESTGWLGKCPNCDSWGSLVETIINSMPSKSVKSGGRTALRSKGALKLTEVKKTDLNRSLTNIPELDRVLGGGMVPGQVVLIAGEPGIGKSTLLTQLANQVAVNKKRVLYVCGEESASQVAVRAQRLSINNSNIDLLEDTDADSVSTEIAAGTEWGAVIVDSIQTMTTSDLSGMAGSVGQVRECAFRLLSAAKEKGLPLFLVGHVTKEGTVAGPAVLAHLVDTVLWFEGDKTLTTRILRAVKNRFGPTDEVGVFEMAEKGLVSMKDIEKAFLEKNGKNVSGSIVTSVMQGSRPLLVEIQALVVPTKLAIPRRIAQGIDSRRLELLLAVLTRRCGLPLYDFDVYVNIAGGLKVTEPASDLAICMAIASSFYDKPIPANSIAVGEVGLLGEVRNVVAEEKRLKESRQMGFSVQYSSKDYKYVNTALSALKKP